MSSWSHQQVPSYQTRHATVTPSSTWCPTGTTETGWLGSSSLIRWRSSSEPMDSPASSPGRELRPCTRVSYQHRKETSDAHSFWYSISFLVLVVCRFIFLFFSLYWGQKHSILHVFKIQVYNMESGGVKYSHQINLWDIFALWSFSFDFKVIIMSR